MEVSTQSQLAARMDLPEWPVYGSNDFLPGTLPSPAIMYLNLSISML